MTGGSVGNAVRCRIEKKHKGWELGAVCAILLLVPGATMFSEAVVIEEVTAGIWNIEIVDSIGDVGLYTSLALDSNDFPHVSYYDLTNHSLKYARWNGSSWSITRVDSGGDVGLYTSIALDKNDYPHISYFDWVNADLKYARWNGSGWDMEIVDWDDDIGRYSSMVVDDAGYPHISYCDFVNSYLKYASWNESGWRIETVGSGCGVGCSTSIELDDSSYPRISFFDQFSFDLMYARWNGSAWEVQRVDSVGDVGVSTSLALDTNDYPHISYFDMTNNDLDYARWNGSGWSIQRVDFVGTASLSTSIALDDSDYPHIGYYDHVNDDLKYAWWNGTAWNLQVVDSAGEVGWDVSIALDSSNQPHVSYYDYTNGDLKYARGKRNNPPDTPLVPSGPTSGLVEIPYAYSTSTTDPDGDQVKYTFDWDDSTSSQTGYVDSGVSANQSHNWSKSGTYSVMVMATDVYGKSSGWSSPLTVTITGVPSEPSNLIASARNAEVVLTWIAPSDNGSSPITNYTMYRGMASGAETFLVEAGDVLTFTDTGLNNGVTYYYMVAAKNAIGEGPKSEEVSATPMATLPSPPINLVVTSNIGCISIAWSPPLDDGGSPIINYTVYRSVNGFPYWPYARLGDMLTFTDASVRYPDSFSYFVIANNSLGASQPSNDVTAVPILAPSPSDIFDVVAGAGQITMRWWPPFETNGAPVTHYSVYRGTTPGGEVFLTTTPYTGVVETFTDTGLMNGQTYYYYVTAWNLAGEGADSNEVNATPASVPGAPTVLTATASNSEVTLTWSPPADSGGLPITNYVIYRGTVSGGETLLTQIDNLLTYTDSGLTNGVTYYYKVAGLNAVGQGPNSTEASATPATIPGAPRDLSAVAGDGHTTLTWSAPTDDGGLSISGYTVWRGTASGGEVYLETLTNVLTYVDTGLTNGQTYYYTVNARNDVGSGPNSTEVNATPATTPSEPLNLSVSYVWDTTAGSGCIVLTWSLPATDGGSPITNYRIYRGTEPGNETLLVVVANVLNYNDTTAAPLQKYYYRVSAVNAIGEGPNSTEVTAELHPRSPPLGPKSILEEPWFWALVAMAIIILVAVAFFIMRRRRGEKQEEDKPQEDSQGIVEK